MDVIPLVALKEFEVRFSEVDSMGIVWHGSYAKYFEDGREEFGKKFGLGYMFIFRNGFYAPLVDLNFQFKKPLPYETKAVIETKYINTPAAKEWNKKLWVSPYDACSLPENFHTGFEPAFP